MNRLTCALLLLPLLPGPVLSQTGGAKAYMKFVYAKVNEANIEFFIGDKLVTRYHTKGITRPVFWPISAPGGTPLTRPFPMEKARPGEATDRVEQESAWFGHGDIIPEGLKLGSKIRGVDGVDFWSKAEGHGTIKVRKAYPAMMKPAFFAEVHTENEWRTGDGTKILDEYRTISVHNLGGAHLIVIDVWLSPTAHPIIFGDTRQGTFAVRMNHDISGGKGKIQNAEGRIGEEECWGRVSPWCDYSGTIEGKSVGLAIFADTKNPYPTCWDSRAYGFMAANPFGRDRSGFPDMKGKTDRVTLAKGDSMRLRYALLLHEGDAVTGRVAEYYQRFLKRNNDDD